ncbi:DNA topoisomerase (ATP-hydrolyzing) subunit A [Avibacterium paragallinarum]|uniref:DNA topoisomerase (ATP-hydrolyzing) subunit A n=1 Tax=Avibacterium paragallinarum TaxID=728 RepID=UPI001451ADB4|nr:DNA topoisomerase (ATP-hydrolyzing) subunit A [Avibacterium paragallinarum]QJE09958.1 DNA topoisomerase (ATP-hydrolyzing) subunit A [Avibacterium paragallinarum]QJE12154.1 DNA topoisomerase (ATP-hydrolyzing) subunit A [Avibacterium paragallinarum]QJE14355.1 DNA topoisomerase (ATP-hydrolyzing) subunit A [Avibacterium paragallinarum]QJE16554.1 DNA topoisomerase (ATP-hydrolyzing) subunit A [Avibacterium paragallinarum]QJE18750.1 DNA topoisomerase (ATP-hydrolyzing) subunit A [Avibacterium parag
MTNLVSNVTPVSIEEELKSSYLDYAMSVIVGRALPDVRDGLKPVHRRVLYSMDQSGITHNKAYVKSARVVGDVIGKYHPHGDSAVYDTIVRMAQPFSLRYMLVDGQGNFGSVDGDAPAAMRYTEVRMQKITQELLTDLDKETVDFSPNYDGKEMIPDVLPTKIPALLVNGSSGIAVGMATNIPPHNLGEVLDGCLAYLDNEEISIDELMQFIPGPDFPTAALINGRKGIEDAYKTGRGKVYVRAKAEIETSEKGRETIVVTEIPYQVNKARLVEKIAELVRDKKIEGISNVLDVSNKEGFRIEIEIKRDAVGEVVLNNLYALTQMQVTFGINMVALDHGQPKLFNLKQIIEAFVKHRREVVTRRTVFELRKARERAHILEGLAIALANIDPVIELIRASKTGDEAREALLSRGWELGNVSAMLEAAGMDASRPEDLSPELGVRDGLYYLSEEQARAILDLRLQRLTGLEHEKIVTEYQEILVEIGELLHILNSTERLREVVREELERIKTEFNDERRTEITMASGDINLEDLIAQEDVVVTLSHEGYVKYQPLTDYEAQRRGGKGKSATKMKEEDFIEKLLVANTHDTILCFSSRGRLYWLKVYQLPQASRGARGRPIVNILPLDENERITAILPISAYEEDKFVVMATAGGIVKKIALTEFSRPRSSGIIALNLRDEDELIGVDITNGNDEIMLFSSQGRVVRFAESAVRPMGRTATGVRGIKLALTNDLSDDESAVEIEDVSEDNSEETLDLNIDKVVSLVVPKNAGAILTATQNGYGKRTALEEYPTKSRNTKGVISIKVSERNGKVVAATQVEESDQIMLITDAGTLVRTRVNEVSIVGRNTQGVRLIRTAEDEQVVSLERVCDVDDEESDIETDNVEE